MSNDIESQAVNNLASSICETARIPDRVFTPEFTEIYVMDFRRLLSESAVQLLKTLMKFEKSESIAMACLVQGELVDVQYRQNQVKDWRDDVFFVTAETKDETYTSFLKRNTKEFWNRTATPKMRPPWMIVAEILGACSDLGSWCIFWQLNAEMALLGFKRSPGIVFEKKMYSDFNIERLDEALRRDDFFGEPSNEYTEKQRAILRSAYLP